MESAAAEKRAAHAPSSRTTSSSSSSSLSSSSFSSASSSKPHAASKSPFGGSDANDKAVDKQASRFLCEPEYHNDIPAPPIEPKFLTMDHLDRDRFSRFTLPSVEIATQMPILSDTFLGVRIDLMNMGSYQRPAHVSRDSLDPADRALLDGEDAFSSLLKKKLLAHETILSKPEYLGNVGSDSKHWMKTIDGEKQYVLEKVKAERERELVLTMSKSERVRGEFAAMQKAPVHPTDKSMKPLHVVPVLPDLLSRFNRYEHILFNSDPAEELKKRNDERKRAALEKGEPVPHGESTAILRARLKRALIHSYDTQTHGMYAPIVAEKNPDGSMKNTNGREYEWVKEHTVTISAPVKTDDNYFFVLSRDNKEPILYGQYDSRMTLRKRAMQTNQDGIDETADLINSRAKKLRVERSAALTTEERDAVRLAAKVRKETEERAREKPKMNVYTRKGISVARRDRLGVGEDDREEIGDESEDEWMKADGMDEDEKRVLKKEREMEKKRKEDEARELVKERNARLRKSRESEGEEDAAEEEDDDEEGDDEEEDDEEEQEERRGREGEDEETTLKASKKNVIKVEKEEGGVDEVDGDDDQVAKKKKKRKLIKMDVSDDDEAERNDSGNVKEGQDTANTGATADEGVGSAEKGVNEAAQMTD